MVTEDNGDIDRKKSPIDGVDKPGFISNVNKPHCERRKVLKCFIYVKSVILKIFISLTGLTNELTS